MRPELETYHLIDRYLNGELDETARIAFEQELASNSELAEELDYQKMVNTVVAGAAIEKLKAQMSADIQELDSKKGKTVKWLGAVALGLVCVGMIGYFLVKQNPVPTIEKQVDSKNDTLSSATLLSKDESSGPLSEIEKAVKRSSSKIQEVILEKAKDTTVQVRENKIIFKEADKPTAIQEGQQNLISENVVDPCSNITLDFTPSVQASCENERNGSVSLSKEKIVGGKGPYLISIDTKSVRNTEVFYDLIAGEHIIYIQDGNGCEGMKKVIVPEKKCRENKFAFNPDLNETWKFPVEAGEVFSLSIVNRNGEVVYKQLSSENNVHEWTGNDLSGRPLDGGLYAYVIEYASGRKEKGQITILK